MIISRFISEKNKSSVFKVIFENMKINSKIYFGGPVNLQNCFVLHDNSYLSKDTVKISNNIALTSNNKIIVVVSTKPYKDF